MQKEGNVKYVLDNLLGWYSVCYAPEQGLALWPGLVPGLQRHGLHPVS